jgi:hypothetical protein
MLLQDQPLCRPTSALGGLRIDDGLDLQGTAGRDVGDRPASLLADTLLGRRQERQKRGESTGRDDNLSLEVVTGHNIADRSERGGLHRGRRVPTIVSACHYELRQTVSLEEWVLT